MCASCGRLAVHGLSCRSRDAESHASRTSQMRCRIVSKMLLWESRGLRPSIARLTDAVVTLAPEEVDRQLVGGDSFPLAKEWLCQRRGELPACWL